MAARAYGMDAGLSVGLYRDFVSAENPYFSEISFFLKARFYRG